MSIIDRESTAWPVRRQSAVGRSRRRAAGGRLMLAALLAAVAGCNSIYHRSRPTLSPDPCAELRLRIHEARQAESAVAQAGGRLRDHLTRGVTGDALRADLDRLEGAVLDLDRRVATAREAARACPGQAPLTSEVDGLAGRSASWLDYLHAAREADPASRLPRLEELLRGPPPPELAPSR